MYSYGPPLMAEQKQDDQLEHIFSSYVRIRDVALKTCQRRWTIGRSGERVRDICANGTTWWWWCNYCWHGFLVRFWWPRVLWQAVTLWLVNREMAVLRSRPIVQRYNRKGSTWYENHAVKFWDNQSSQDRESSWGYAADQRRYIISDDRLCKGVQALASHGSGKKIWGKKKSPFWVYVSPSLSQTYNKLCAPFENKMREKYFYTEMCFGSFIEVH